ncbi:hypothetical protein [Amycolatopsis sp. cmx-11-12]|uniref:hypothetical protein n=1 Tax=Amycolatopsis sp. cmx-11-12 TaxID=2785795 RepID=UPI003917CBAB
MSLVLALAVSDLMAGADAGVCVGFGLAIVAVSSGVALKTREVRMARYGRHSPQYVRRHPAETTQEMWPVARGLVPIDPGLVGEKFVPVPIDDDWKRSRIRDYIDGLPERVRPVAAPRQLQRIVDGAVRDSGSVAA